MDCRITFFKEFFYHVFFPLSLPMIYWFEGGTNGIMNRQFWGSRLAIAQWILAIACKCQNISYAPRMNLNFDRVQHCYGNM